MASASYGHRRETQGERRTVLIALVADGVRTSSGCKTKYTGPKSLLVAARTDLADGVERVEKLADELDERLREAVPDLDQVFLDPTPRRSG